MRSQARLTSVNVLKFPQPRSISAVAYLGWSTNNRLFQTQCCDGKLSASERKNLPSIFKHKKFPPTNSSGQLISTALSSAANRQCNRRNYSFRSAQFSSASSIDLESIEVNRFLHLLITLFVVIWISISTTNTTEAAEESKGSLEDEDFATPRVDDLTLLANLPPKLEFPYYQVIYIFIYCNYIHITKCCS